MVKSIDMPAFSAGGGVASKLDLEVKKTRRQEGRQNSDNSLTSCPPALCGLSKAAVVAALAGAMTFGAPAMAEHVYTVVDGASDDYSYTTTDGVTTLYKKIIINTTNMKTSTKIDWEKSGSSVVTTSWDGTKAKGTIKVTMPHNGATQDEYYTYTYTKPDTYTTSTRITNIMTDNTDKKVFVNNTSGNGGAISNNDNKSGINILSDFIMNTANNYGGAIYNHGTIGTITGDFIGNTANQQGGAIYNGGGTIGTITGDFIGNKGFRGGAIYNDNNGTIGTIEGDFIGNTSTNYHGGAICNVSSSAKIDSITGDFIGNTSSASGGAIYNGGTITTIKGDFIGNTANQDGGAIYNTSDGSIGIITGDFIGNTANQDGGAIYNKGTITSITGDFIGNTGSYGGAICNYGGTIAIVDSNFTGNTASSYGGAIATSDGSYTFSNSVTNIVAKNNDVVFLNNTANGSQNDIYNSGGAAPWSTKYSATLNLNTASGKNIILNGGIDGDTAYKEEYNIVNINKTVDDLPTAGTVVFNGAVKNQTLNMYNGTLQLGTMANMFDNVDMNMHGGTINSINNAVNTYNFTNLTVVGNTDVAVDVDLAAETMDRFTADNYGTHTGNINVVGINLISDATKDNTSVPFADDNLKGNVTTSVSEVGASVSNPYQTAFAPIYKYDVLYNSSNGNFEFVRSSGGGSESFNPAVLAAPVAAQLGGITSQRNSYDQASMNMDMNMLFTREQRRAMKLQNRYAMADTTTGHPEFISGSGNRNSGKMLKQVQHDNYGISRGQEGKLNNVNSLTSCPPALQSSNKLAYDTQTPMVYSNTYLPERDLAAWARPYTSFETVNLRKGPHVNNTMYGMYLGGDSEMYELKHNWDFQYSVYAGYNGSRQSYSDVTILQNGGTLGATGIFYHDNFFTALTANVGAGVANADTMYGHEDFAMLSTGVASKTGYNWELAKGRFIIQPSWLMSYSFVNTFDYTNAAGVRISSDPIHAIQLAPQLKFIGNLPHGWQPYASVQMVWNIMDESRFKANNVSLPNMSMGPFIQYGVGVQKRWGERFTGFVQTMIRNGSRTGVAFTLGFRWALGKDKPKTSAATQRTVIK